MMRIGLVLGGGGVLGGAWEIGALHALERQTGWDPRDAEYFIGTSAGALMAALLAAGVVPRIDLVEATERHVGLIPWPVPGSMHLGLHGLRSRGPRRLLMTAAGLLPRGSLSTEPIRQAVTHRIPGTWPRNRRLLIVAADYRTGDRIVFRRDGSPPAELASAVAASCAIPGVYQPVEIGGRLFVDGGLYSADNLDLLLGTGVDLAICINPLSSGCPGTQRRKLTDHLFMLAEHAAHRQLMASARLLRRAGIRVLVIEPGPEDLRAMGLNMMSRKRIQLVMETALKTVAEQLQSSTISDLLRPIASAPGR